MTRTRFIARLIGLFLLVLAASLVVNGRSMGAMFGAVAHDPTFLFTYGMLALGAGLAMVIAHNRWRGGVLTVLVTILGWLFTLRGVVLLCAPPNLIAGLFDKVQFAQHDLVYAGVMGVLGLALAVLSFTSKDA
jgi:hypothetical protein